MHYRHTLVENATLNCLLFSSLTPHSVLVKIGKLRECLFHLCNPGQSKIHSRAVFMND